MTTGDAGKVIGAPELPEGWVQKTTEMFPGVSKKTMTTWGCLPYVMMGQGTVKDYNFLEALLNAVYSPGGLKQQLTDLQQRVRASQDAIKQLVLAGDEHHAMTDCEGWCKWQLAKVVAEKLLSD